LRWALSLALAVTAAGAFAVPASAAPPTHRAAAPAAGPTGDYGYIVGIYMIETWLPVQSCIDADTGTLGNYGTKIQIWHCAYDHVQANQRWALWWYPNNGYLRFQNTGSHTDLDADANTINSNGTKVQLWGRIESGWNQRWYLTNCTTPVSFSVSSLSCEIASAASGRLLDVYAARTGDGTPIQLWERLSRFQKDPAHLNQWWILRRVADL
jgi:hypothetical protein